MDEQAFLQNIADNPNEAGPKLVFADYLEEQGQCERAASLRELCFLSEVPKLSDEQQGILNQILEWHDRKHKPILTVGGYAGTGKTTMIRHLIDQWPGCAVATLSGKAAYVLRSKGVKFAQTIHSLIYSPVRLPNGVLHFIKKPYLTAENDRPANEIIIDEASMVNERIYRDLLSYEKPILFVGDHGQLEPIGRDIGLMRDPELKLTTIHRQAQNNPIIRLAHAFREQKSVPYWKDKNGRVEIVDSKSFWEQIYDCDMAICGMNKTRHMVNKLIREKRKIKSPLPIEGDRIICLRNNHEFGVFNGQHATCVKTPRKRGRWITLEIRLDDDRIIEADCYRDQFGRCLTPEERDDIPFDVLLFDFGYCLTAHKAQGSEAESVAVMEELIPIWNSARWRYTAATRARSRLIYCQ